MTFENVLLLVGLHNTERTDARDARYIWNGYIIGLMMEHLHYRLSVDKEIIADNSKTECFCWHNKCRMCRATRVITGVDNTAWGKKSSSRLTIKSYHSNALSNKPSLLTISQPFLHSGVHKESIKLFLLSVFFISISHESQVIICYPISWKKSRLHIPNF